MKRFLTTTLALVAAAVLVTAPALACGEKKADASGKKASCCAKGEKGEKTAAKGDHCAAPKAAEKTAKPAAEDAKAPAADKKG